MKTGGRYRRWSGRSRSWPRARPVGNASRRCSPSAGSRAARGLRICCDWGPQYIADAWISEVKWLGMTISPSYVGEPACNGVIERFIRTLKEQGLYLHRFQTLEEADHRGVHRVLQARVIVERLGYRTPAQARAQMLPRGA